VDKKVVETPFEDAISKKKDFYFGLLELARTLAI
jgi:hypothetical protein